jgi:uncharacterized protein
VLAPKGRAASFDASHFEIYFGELFEAATGEMIRFLDDHLAAAAEVAGCASPTVGALGRRPG